jgi:hypothetical protein
MPFRSLDGHEKGRRCCSAASEGLVLTRISLEVRPPDGGVGGPADIDGKKLPRPRINGSVGEPSTVCSVQHLVHCRDLLSDYGTTLRDR